MKKQVIVFTVLAVITFATSLLVSRTENRDYTYQYKGWPLTYQKTIDTGGLCVGIEGAKEITPCGLREFPIRSINLAGNLALSLALAVIVTYALYRSKKI